MRLQAPGSAAGDIEEDTTKHTLIQATVWLVAIFVIPILGGLLAVGGLLFAAIMVALAVVLAPFVLVCVLLGRWVMQLAQSHEGEANRSGALIPGSASSEECGRISTPTEQQKPQQ